MRRPRLAPALLLVTLLAAAVRAQAPPAARADDAAIRLETSLVTVPVIVHDRDDKYVAGLRRPDFRLFEDKVEQEIDSFAAFEVPFHVVLLLDTSVSTRFKLEDIQRAAQLFVGHLRPHDQVLVASFDQEIEVHDDFTSDPARLRQAIARTRTGGATRLYDALTLVLAERLRRVEGRKAVVLFTDGVDTASRFAAAEGALELIEESGALVYAVRYDTQDDVAQFGRPLAAGRRPRVPMAGLGVFSDEYRRAATFLADVAERSGARLYEAETLGDLDRAFASIAEELRHQYALSYYPTNAARDGSLRRIRVRVARPDVIVRARKGYRASAEAEPPGRR